jgi:carbohydrate kinase (thermoresistant glucokinase family)
MNIVIMGVAGCGKTEVGRYLSQHLPHRFYDGDDFHPESNVTKMSQGMPLTDEDRQGWLASLRQLMLDNEARGNAVIIACSALKQAYREQLKSNNGPLFVHLQITPAAAESRLRNRQQHFMPASLVKSQFDTLEHPRDAINIDAMRPLADVLGDVFTQVSRVLHGDERGAQ